MPMIGATKLSTQKLYKFYCDPFAKFKTLAFDDYNVIGTLTNQNLPMNWF